MLLKQLPSAHSSSSSVPSIKVVCISDIHNKQPHVLPGDLLIHAGGLTENGPFSEVRAGLTWLSSQLHKYKILITGNRDVLLNDKLLEKYPERRYGQTKSNADLSWGSVIYLGDTSVTLDFSRGAILVAAIFLQARL